VYECMSEHDSAKREGVSVRMCESV